MKLQHILSTLPPKDWRVNQIVVFDWLDGPRQGIARMAKPECEFVFEVMAERQNPEGLDDRLLRVGALPPGSVGKILKSIHSLGTPMNAVWVPVWKFETENERLDVESEIDRILSQQQDTGLVIHSRDMTTVLGCWHGDQINGHSQDWFSLLHIS